MERGAESRPRARLVPLLACNLIPWTMGNGLLPLMPVYAGRLGASPQVAGYLMATAYGGVVVGTLAAGWLADRVQRPKAALVAAGAALVPVIWLMGQAASLAVFGIALTLAWLLAGAQVALINIMTGLAADHRARGASFAFVGLAPVVGQLVGGLASGALADAFGYRAMFTATALFVALLPLLAVFVVAPPILTRSTVAATVRAPIGAAVTGSLRMMLVAFSLGSMAAFLANLVRSVVMDELGYRAAQISGTVALTAAVGLPVILAVGRLSDRFGRRPLLLLSAGGNCVAAALLAVATTAFHFYGAAALLGLRAADGAVGSAHIADLVDKRALGTALALLGIAPWIGGVVGFAIAGVLMESMGSPVTSLIGSGLALCGFGVLLFLRAPGHRSLERLAMNRARSQPGEAGGLPPRGR